MPEQMLQSRLRIHNQPSLPAVLLSKSFFFTLETAVVKTLDCAAGYDRPQLTALTALTAGVSSVSTLARFSSVSLPLLASDGGLACPLRTAHCTSLRVGTCSRRGNGTVRCGTCGNPAGPPRSSSVAERVSSLTTPRTATTSLWGMFTCSLVFFCVW